MIRHASVLPTQKDGGITRGYLICIVATVFWSTTAIFIRYLTDKYALPALVLAYWRDLFVFLSLGFVFILFNRKNLVLDRQNIGFFLIYGLVLAVFNSLWTISVSLNGAAVSTVLAYSSAGFTAILGWRILGEQLGKVKLLAVLLSLVGCVFVSGAYDPANWQLNPLGIVTGLCSGVAFAAYSLFGRAASRRQVSPWQTMLFVFGFASLFLLGFNFLKIVATDATFASEMFWLGTEWAAWLILILLAIGPTMGGFGLYTVSLGYLPASVANLIATLEPVMTAVLAYFLLGERLSAAQLWGSLLIVSGVVILRLYESRPKNDYLTTNTEQPA